MLAVTGITGHTGRFFLEELVKNRFPGKIRCLVRDTAREAALKETGLGREVAAYLSRRG